MIVPSKNQKTYGVLHTENYFSFLGFCKKVNSDEIQKVDIYLDDVLIDITVLNDSSEESKYICIVPVSRNTPVASSRILSS